MSHFLANRARLSVLEFPSLFSSGYALFHFPYPASPLLAALTKTTGVCTNSFHSGTPHLLVATCSHLPVAAAPSSFVFIFFRTLLHSFALFCSSRRSNTLVFKRFRTLCEKHPGGGRSPTLVCPVCPELRRDRFLRREQSSTLQQETSAPFVLFPYNPPGCGKLVHK